MVWQIVLELGFEAAANEAMEELNGVVENSNDQLVRECQESAKNLMHNMTGNNGQETIVTRYEPHLDEYIEEAVEDPSKHSWQNYADHLKKSGQQDSAYDGTIVILQTCFEFISEFVTAKQTQDFVGMAVDVATGIDSTPQVKGLPQVGRVSGGGGFGIGLLGRLTIRRGGGRNVSGNQTQDQYANQKYGGGARTRGIARIRAKFYAGPSDSDLRRFASVGSNESIAGRNYNNGNYMRWEGNRLVGSYMDDSQAGRYSYGQENYERSFATQRLYNGRRDNVRSANGMNEFGARQAAGAGNTRAQRYLQRQSFLRRTGELWRSNGHITNVDGRAFEVGDNVFRQRWGSDFDPLFPGGDRSNGWDPIRGYRQEGEDYRQVFLDYHASGDWRSATGPWNTSQPMSPEEAEFVARVAGQDAGRPITYAGSGDAFSNIIQANYGTNRGLGGGPRNNSIGGLRGYTDTPQPPMGGPEAFY